MFGISSRTSSSISCFGSFSRTWPERGSSRRESPTRMTWSRSASESIATWDSSPRPITITRSSSTCSLTVTTSPWRSWSRISTTLRASLRMTSTPLRRRSRSSEGSTETRIFRPAVNTSATESSSSTMARNTPNVAGGWVSFSTSSLSASILSRSAFITVTSFSFWARALDRSARVWTSFSSRIFTWRGAFDRRRRNRATSSSRNLIWVSSSCRSFSYCSNCSRESWGIVATSCRPSVSGLPPIFGTRRSGLYPVLRGFTARGVEPFGPVRCDLGRIGVPEVLRRDGVGPRASRPVAAHRDEARVAHHAVIGADAALGDEPGPEHQLERLHLLELVVTKGQGQRLDLDRRGEVGAQDAARLEDLGDGLEHPPRLRHVQDHPVEPLAGLRDLPEVAAAHGQVRRLLAEEHLHVRRGLLLELRPELVRGDTALGAHRAAQGQGQRAGPRSGLEDARARPDVRVHQDRREVFRVHHLRAAGHLQHEVDQAGPEHLERRALRGVQDQALVAADDVRERHVPPVEVELAVGLEPDQVPPPPRIEQEHAFPRFERRAHVGSASHRQGRRRAAVQLGREDLLGQLAGHLAVALRLLGGRAESLPQDLGPGPAERAEPAGGGLPAPFARRQLRCVLVLEQRRRPIDVSQQELGLGPGARPLELVHRGLVPELGVPADQRALLHHIVDPAQERVRGGLQLGQPDQRFDLLHHALARREDRELPGDVLGLPPKRVPEQRGSLVVQVVAGGHHVEPVVQGHPVEHVPLREAAHGACGPGPLLAGGGDVVAVLAAEVHVDEVRFVFVGEGLRDNAGALRVLADPEPQVHPGGPVSQIEEDLPQPQGVLAARDGDHDPFVRPEHPVRLDGALHRLVHVVHEALLAEGGVVPPDLHHGRPPAPPAPHSSIPPEPPEITGRTSISSPSSSRSSRVTSALSRITSTVSGSMPSSASTSRTRRGPPTDTSRSGFRSRTFTQKRLAQPARPNRPARHP